MSKAFSVCMYNTSHLSILPSWEQIKMGKRAEMCLRLARHATKEMDGWNKWLNAFLLVFMYIDDIKRKQFSDNKALSKSNTIRSELNVYDKLYFRIETWIYSTRMFNMLQVFCSVRCITLVTIDHNCIMVYMWHVTFLHALRVLSYLHAVLYTLGHKVILFCALY